MSIVKSIPWMPEKAWTTCRSGAAISGLTRSGFSPDHLQLEPPCDPLCLPPPEIIWIWDDDLSISLGGSLTLNDLDEGSFPAPDTLCSGYELYEATEGGSVLLGTAATFADVIWTPAEARQYLLYLRFFWGDSGQCFGEQYQLPIVTVEEPPP